MTEENSEPYQPIQNKVLSPVFRLAAGFLFFLAVPIIYFDVQGMILGHSGMIDIGQTCLFLYAAHISGTVLFTGFAPGYLVNLTDANGRQTNGRAGVQ